MALDLAKLKKMNYYSKLGLTGTALILMLLLVGNFFGFDISLFFPEWYLNLLPVPFVLARSMAAASYIGTEIDLRNKPNKEKWGTGLGIAFGIALGLSMDILTPFGSSSTSIIQSILLVVSCINTNGSLGNRIASCGDGTDRRLQHERYTIGIFTILGFALGMTLLFIGAAAAVSLVGVTSFFTAGAPIVLASIFFVATVTSQMASTGDYVSKTCSYLGAKFNLTDNNTIKERVAKKSHEYLGAAVGVGAALVFAAIIITALAVTQPHLFVGILGVITAAFIITTCVSVLAGIISRVGRWYGNYCDVLEMEKAESAKQGLADDARPDSTFQLQNSLVPQPSNDTETMPEQGQQTNLQKKPSGSPPSSEHLGSTSSEESMSQGRSEIAGSDESTSRGPFENTAPDASTLQRPLGRIRSLSAPAAVLAARSAAINPFPQRPSNYVAAPAPFPSLPAATPSASLTKRHQDDTKNVLTQPKKWGPRMFACQNANIADDWSVPYTGKIIPRRYTK